MNTICRHEGNKEAGTVEFIGASKGELHPHLEPYVGTRIFFINFFFTLW